jgi:CAAX protease family protein
MAENNGFKRYTLVIFCVLAYAITYGLSLVTVSDHASQAAVGLSGTLLHYGPTLAAIILAAVISGGKGLGELLRPLGKWRVGVYWYLFALLFPLCARLIAVGLDLLLGGSAPTFFSAAGIPADTNPLLLIVPVFIGVFFQAGLAEEIGWRGFALPRLQARYNALVSSLILGVLWTFWHFHPVNWPQIAPVAGWYVLIVIAFTVILTWVYNNTNGSLLLVVLMHTASNTSDWIVPIVPTLNGLSRAALFDLAIFILVAAVLVAVFGAERLSRKPLPDTVLRLKPD